MGQYWKPVNHTKKELVNVHTLAKEGDFFGLKFGEQSYNCPELLYFLVVQPNSMGDGGGDFNDIENCKNMGRWAGDQVEVIGDYDHDEKRYEKCEKYKDIGAEIQKDFYLYRKWLGKDEDEKPAMRPDMILTVNPKAEK